MNASSCNFLLDDAAPPEIYTLPLHDALPIYGAPAGLGRSPCTRSATDERSSPTLPAGIRDWRGDRKSTRLNSSHVANSYAVFCLKKKTTELMRYQTIT